MKKKVINLVITLVVALVLYYITVPAINLTSPGFYAFLFAILIIFGLLELGTNVVELINNRRFKMHFNVIFLIPVIVLIIILSNFVCSPLFNSRSYSSRIEIDETKNFADDIEEVDFSRTPLLDRDSSEKLGDRVMGNMSDFVSQYYVSDLYTQINYKNDIVRVTPLEYADIIKYFSNRKDGIKGYITVNSVDGSADVVKLDKGMKYVPSAMFNEDTIRHLRFKYPTAVFGDYTFEIDDEGNPYFIVPIIKYTSVGLKADIKSVIILDPISGDSKKYDVGDVPTWVDHVYSADLIIEQTDNWGTYKEGFWNSVFTQKNVVNTTDGYNYLAMNDDIYLYTGITSVQSDESNLGFILCNLRTKETVYYSVTGAEEFSAMSSAEGQVQQMSYTATFPLLINLSGRATYLISLKDAAGLVKMYAFVDVADYQKVTVTDASSGIKAAADNYLKEYASEVDDSSLTTESIKVASIKTVTIGGNTIYYLTDSSANRYKIDITVSQDTLPFIAVSDTLNVSYADGLDIRIVKKLN